MKRNGVFFLIPALLLTLASCAPASGGVSVTASGVKSESLLGDTSYSASLQAAREVTVVPGVSATITAVNVQVGDPVTEGDVLLTLDSADVENQYRQAEAACGIAEINLENTRNGSAAWALSSCFWAAAMPSGIRVFSLMRWVSWAALSALAALSRAHCAFARAFSACCRSKELASPMDAR